VKGLARLGPPTKGVFMEYVARYTAVKCRTCGLDYLPVQWLESRVRGYCCAECDPTVVEEEDPQTDLFAPVDNC
jgi:hypothetical protein